VTKGPVRDPLVSVLVPVRDEAEYLGESLRSLAAQTLEDFEVLVVDDGSVDGTADVAAGLAAADDRFRLIRQPPLGVVAAAERARAEARGRYVACMDGDDVARPERLRLQLERLEAEGLAACGGGVAYFSAGRVTVGLRRYQRWLNSLTTVELVRRDVFVECPVANPTLFARADVLAAVGGYRETPWPEDYDLVLRLWASGARFRNLEAVVLDWRDHPDRLSRTSPRYSVEAFARCRVHHLCSSLLRDRREAVIWGAGPVGKLFARELRAAGVVVAAFVDVDPRKLGKRIYGIPVVAHEVAVAPEALALGAVAGAAARARLRELARGQDRQEGVDFVAVA
jgi:cellulose synthase/poly-beta-1,6-N-acetylglucosamine synthase-like glycosyltransferase